MTEQNKTGFIIYDFMIDKLCLTGVPLMVFALIYSFTAAGADCHGSIEYMAIRVGASISSVKRALGLLLDRGLILKFSDSKMRTKIYKANPITLLGKDPALSKIEPPETELVADLISAENESDLGYNNKDIIKTTSTTSSTEQSEWNIPSFVNPGPQGIAVMTIEQHLDLREKLGKETLEYYLMRLEDYLITNPGKWIKSHYKTILKWVREDAQLE